MKACKLLLYALFVLSLAAGNGLADEIFRFAVLCDSRGQLATSRCEDDNYGVNSTLDVMVKDIVARNAAESVKLVLFPGDMIHGVLKRDAPSVAECNRVSLNHWREVVSPLLKAGIIMRVTAGNHETVVADASKPRLRCGDHLSPYFTEMENFKVFREVLGDMIDGTPGPESDLGLTYSFDMGGCHSRFSLPIRCFTTARFPMRPLTGSTGTWAKQERPDLRPLWCRTRRLFLVGDTCGTLFHSLIPLIIATITMAVSA